MISQMSDQLSSATPGEAGIYPITLKQLCQRCTEVPGSDASLQVLLLMKRRYLMWAIFS
jgi:hypothetical protein